ncbi:MAG: hypothetical protein PWR26_748 [Methanosarcinales archaeon]|nr:hypothetical protein [Methanosarcinales archaeon]MDN5295652.1 hypothetical protein [Methanosarcinales archaeon]
MMAEKIELKKEEELRRLWRRTVDECLKKRDALMKELAKL